MPRYEGPDDAVMVEKDAKTLYKAGEKRLGTDEKTFINIFSGRGRAHWAAVNCAYHNMYGRSLEKVKSMVFRVAIISSFNNLDPFARTNSVN